MKNYKGKKKAVLYTELNLDSFNEMTTDALGYMFNKDGTLTNAFIKSICSIPNQQDGTVSLCE